MLLLGANPAVLSRVLPTLLMGHVFVLHDVASTGSM